MHPRCRLWIRARRGPSAITQMPYNPAASPTATAGSARRRDLCSCRLAGPPGTTTGLPRPRRVYMETPLLRLTPSTGDTPTAYTRSDALGDVARWRFAKPTCHAMMRYVSIGRPSVLLLEVWCPTPCTSVHPSLTSRSWPVRVDYIQPTTTSSYSSVT